MRDESFCCEVTRAAGDSQAGTASEAAVWLLVEYRGPWRARAVEDNDLPRTVQEWLAAQMAALAGEVGRARAAADGGSVDAAAPAPSRLAFVRRDDFSREPDAAMTCFVAVTDEARQELWEVPFSSYEELLATDLSLTLLGGSAAAERFRRTDPLCLVCTNGRRDRCCAKFGLPLVKALDEIVGGRVWQVTHIGGHRYAPSVVWLPDGAYYGLLRPSDARSLVAAHAAGRLYLPGYRGRSFHPRVAQYADCSLRARLGEAGLGALRLASCTEGDDGEWRVGFDVRGRGRLELGVRRDREVAMTSCHPAKQKAIDSFSVTGGWPE